MKIIGVHVSSAGGVDKAIIRANKLNVNACSFFTKNQRQWNTVPLKKIVIEQFKLNCKKYNFGYNQIISHNSYLINLGHPETQKLEKSRITFLDEIKRCEILGINLLVIHPGNHLNKININICLNLISESINFALEQTKNVIIVIENTAGQGSSVGFNFEHLANIINNIKNKKRIGICLDICHAFAAGYDLRTPQKCDNIFNIFNKIIGFEYLKVMHLNDSKYVLGSHIDRHQNLGKGYLGYAPFIYIINNYQFNNIPLILETPNSMFWHEEITWLKSQKNE